MVKAATDILRPDGSVIKKGTVLSDELVREFELLSPQLLDCYITQNSRYWKKIGKKLIPHEKVLLEDLVEVKGPSEKMKKLEAKKKEIKKKREKKPEDMTKKQLDKYAESLGIKLDRRKSKEGMLKEFYKKK